MQLLASEDIEFPAARTPSRWTLRGFAVDALVVCAFALLVGFLSAFTPAHAQARGELRIGYQKSASLFVLQKAQGTLETPG